MAAYHLEGVSGKAVMGHPETALLKERRALLDAIGSPEDKSEAASLIKNSNLEKWLNRRSNRVLSKKFANGSKARHRTSPFEEKSLKLRHYFPSLTSQIGDFHNTVPPPGIEPRSRA
jgi:hypothetical protein